MALKRMGIVENYEVINISIIKYKFTNTSHKL